MLIRGGPGIFQPKHQKGMVLRLFLILSTYILVCFSEHWYSYAPGCSAFYMTTVDASRSYCDSFSVLDGLERFNCLTKKALWWLSTIFHRDWYVFFILFTAANDKRYLALYKLVISNTIIIIIINTWYATISGVADENIDDVGNLHW